MARDGAPTADRSGAAGKAVDGAPSRGTTKRRGSAPTGRDFRTDGARLRTDGVRLRTDGVRLRADGGRVRTSRGTRVPAPADQRRQFPPNCLDHGAPVPRAGLPKHSQSRIPGAVRPPDQPAPVRIEAVEQPHRPPNAADRCATEVSTEITRSRLATNAAVSAKSAISPMKSVSRYAAGAAGPPFCRLIKCTPGTSNSGASRSGPIERRRSTADRAGHMLARIAGPDDPDPKPLVVHRSQARVASGDLRRVGVQIGDPVGDVASCGPQRQRQAQHRAMQVERRQCLAVRHHLGDIRQAAHQPDQRPGRLQDDPQPARRRERRIAAELQVVPEPLLAVHQQSLALGRLAAPLRHAEVAIRRRHLRRLPAPFVLRPALGQVSPRQQRHRQVAMRVRIIRVQRQRPPVASYRFVQLPLLHQRGAQAVMRFLEIGVEVDRPAASAGGLVRADLAPATRCPGC